MGRIRPFRGNGEIGDMYITTFLMIFINGFISAVDRLICLAQKDIHSLCDKELR